MSVASPTSEECLIELDGRRTTRLLELASRRHASVSLAIRSLPDQGVICGHMVSADSEGVYIQIENVSAAIGLNLVSTCCEVTVWVGDEKFHFQSAVLGVIGEDDHVLIELIRPELAGMHQRRRFGRHRLHESASVHLCEPGSRSAWCCHGALLNIARAGLACRIALQDADRLTIGDRIEVRFQLASEETPFVVVAEVRAKTPASDVDKIVLGLHFPADATDESVLNRLCRAVGDVTQPLLETSNL